MGLPFLHQSDLWLDRKSFISGATFMFRVIKTDIEECQFSLLLTIAPRYLFLFDRQSVLHSSNNIFANPSLYHIGKQICLCNSKISPLL